MNTAANPLGSSRPVRSPGAARHPDRPLTDYEITLEYLLHCARDALKEQPLAAGSPTHKLCTAIDDVLNR